MMFGVSSRTRSKNVPLFSTLSLGRSKRKKIDEDVTSLESVSGSKRRKVKNGSFVFPKSHEVIFIDEDEYDEEGSKECDVDVTKEVKGDESGGSCEIGDKNGNFVDDKCGWDRENPIIMDLYDEQFVGFETDDEIDDVRKEVKVDESGGSGKFVEKDVIFIDSDESESESDEDDDDSDESEEDETSDEDFNVDEVNEIIDNDDDSSSSEAADDDDDDEEEEVEEEEEEEEEEEKKKKRSRKYFSVVEELAREVNDEQSGEKEVDEEKNKKGSRKSFNVVEELAREVNDEKSEEEKKKKNKVNEIPDSGDGSSNDLDVDDDEKEVREDVKENEISDANIDVGSSNDVIVDEKEVREDEKDKVNEIFDVDVDDGSSNVIIVDNEEEKDLKKPNSVVEEDKDVKVNEISDAVVDVGSSNDVIVDEEEKVNAISDVNDVSSNVIIVDNEEEKVRDEGKKDLEKPNCVVEENKEEDLDPLWHERNNCLMEEEQLREVKEKKSEISHRNNEKKKIKTSPSVYNNEKKKIKTSPSAVYNDEVQHSVYGSATASTAFNPMKGCSSKQNEASEKDKAKTVGMKVKNVSSVQTKQENSAKPTEYMNVGDSVKGKKKHAKGLGVGGVSSVQTKQENVKVLDKPTENLKVGDSGEGKERQHVKGLGVGGVSSVQIKQEEVEDLDKLTENVKVGYSVEGKKRQYVLGVSSLPMKQLKVENLDEKKIMESKPREDCQGGINIQNGVKKEPKEKNGLNQRGKSTHSMPKKLPLAQYLAELYLKNKNDTMKNASSVLEVNDDGVNQKDTRQPPVRAETPNLRWSLKRVVPKTKEEEELDKELEKNKPLWDEMERAIRESEAESEIGNFGTNRSQSPHCEHITLLDEELGIYCKKCGDVITEMKYISPLVVDRYPNEGSRNRASIGGDDVKLFNVSDDRSHFNVSDDDSKANVSLNEGTVWDKIPDVKKTLYPHQQEGFEFIWKNLAGSIELQKLMNVDPRSEGGCIISHAPGTGKTRLTIVFLKAYLKLFPNCLPIVVAPASLLLTWEEEFKKWDIGVPFHNLSNLELSGKEDADVCNRFDRYSKDRAAETRMAKLISWFKETSILGISYSLYGSICRDEEKKKNANVKKSKGNFNDMRKVLLEAPGLLVLDEGHTPRNQRSLIWKVLSKLSQTQKRIILSGTPFQNNFWELYSVLSIVKPSFPNTIPPELKKFCKRERKSFEKCGWQPVSGNTARNPSDDDDEIEKLKLLMDPFVHVHKGAILESKLPGLKDCLVTLKAGSLQNEILKIIKRSNNSIFNFERKIALTSVHPSLFLECDLSKEEESVLDKDKLKQLRMNPHEGVKTKFVYEFVRLCDASNEKVLVFSQFHAPLRLIQDQLNSAFNWSNGEVMFMSSSESPKVKQSIIHTFNDENSKAKVLLAATKACSEGISLVGASRVVLLDVVWNPSVERQAISRAYRIGQKKVVYTYHLLAEGTTEEQKYGKQAEKDRLSELLFSAKNATDNDDVPKRRAVNFEDSVLDKMTQHEKLIDMFVKCVVLRKERDSV